MHSDNPLTTGHSRLTGSSWMLMLAIAFPSLFTWIYFVSLAGHASSWQQLAYAIGKGLQFSLPVMWVFGVERRPMQWSWPSWRHRGVAEGGLSGALIALATLAIYLGFLREAPWFSAVQNQIVSKVEGFGISSASGFLALSVFYSAVHSGLEEYYWRWFVFGQLRERTRWITAATVSSLGFMAHHVILLAAYFGWNSALTYFLSFSVAVGGWYWAWLYHRTGRLTGSWLSHLLVDAGIFGVGYLIVQHLFA